MLSNKEIEQLVILQEECAEVIQSVSKILRFGIDSEYNNETNKTKLNKEIGDVFALLQLLSESEIVNMIDVFTFKHQKLEKLKQFTYYQND